MFTKTDFQKATESLSFYKDIETNKTDADFYIANLNLFKLLPIETIKKDKNNLTIKKEYQKRFFIKNGNVFDINNNCLVLYPDSKIFEPTKTKNIYKVEYKNKTFITRKNTYIFIYGLQNNIIIIN
jgi:hypothetical protein